MAFFLVSPEEAQNHKPTIVVVDKKNQIAQKLSHEKANTSL
jgi:aspartate 1-decarboxylase